MLRPVQLPRRSNITLTCALAALAVGGCGSSDALTRGAVKGRVTIGGQPLAKGRILFLPAAPSRGPTVSAPIVGGKYELSLRDGPVAGANRVEVEAEVERGFAIDDEAAFAKRGGHPLPANPIPPGFNAQSQLTVQIRADENNTYDVSVPAAGQSAAKTIR